MTKLAIFDVDGTLFNGNLGIDFVKVLISQKVFPAQIGESIFTWFTKYKNGEVEKSVVMDEIYHLDALGMTGVNYSVVKDLARSTWESIKPKLFSFAPQLVSHLKQANYKICLISGSPIEMVSELGNFLGADNDFTVGGELEIVNDTYTGNIISYPVSAQQKVDVIKQKINDFNLDVDWPHSLGVGDDDRDIGVLQLVGHPVAINPNPTFLEVAQKNHWLIVNESTALDEISKIIT